VGGHCYCSQSLTYSLVFLWLGRQSESSVCVDTASQFLRLLGYGDIEEVRHQIRLMVHYQFVLVGDGYKLPLRLSVRFIFVGCGLVRLDLWFLTFAK
jgi:hypothetical protein